MSKLIVSFDKFSDLVTQAGYTPERVNDSMYYIHTKNGVRLELKNMCFVIGYGLKGAHRETVKSVLTDNGFTLFAKQPTGYTKFELDSMDRFMTMASIIDSVDVSVAKTKEPKVAKIKSAIAEDNRRIKAAKEPKVKAVKLIKVKPKVAEKLTETEIDKIKSANLARMKAVTAKSKTYLPGQVANPHHGPGDGPVRTPADAKKWIEEQERERDYPTFITKDQLKALV